MDDEITENLSESMEHLKGSVVGNFFTMIWLILSCPFVAIARLFVFLVTFGKVAPTMKESYDNGYIMFIAFAIFIVGLFTFHLTIGSQLYGAESNA